MYTIKLMNEYLHGPIWVYDEEGFIRRKYPLIDNDDELQQLNEQARNLYDSFYSFNKDDSACVFDFRRYRVFDANGNVGFCVVLFFTSVRLELFSGEIQGKDTGENDWNG